MKKIAILAVLYAASASAECDNPSAVEYLPAGVLKEYCFDHEVNHVKYGRSMDIEIGVEEAGTIPDSYKAKGVKGIVNFTAVKPGVVSNAFIDTSDGNRIEVTFITTTSEAE